MREPDRYAVIGHPVAHSRSPWIHRAFADATGEAIEYGLLLAPLDAFERTVDAFFADGGRGLNVTLPFKVEAFARCGARVTDRARRAGAANVLAPDDAGRLAGDNTDGVGLVADLDRLGRAAGWSLVDADVLLLGAGGAARGAIGALFDAGIDRLTIVNRDLERAAALPLAFRGLPIDIAHYGQIGAHERFDMIVNATSAGLAREALPLDRHVLGNARLVYDMAYGMAPTRFLDDAVAAGALQVADGLGMLVEQAAESFFGWRGVRPATAPVLAALRARIAEEREADRARARPA